MSTEQRELSSCCISGHIHAGTPKGTEQQIGGLRTYVAKDSKSDKKKTVIFLPDIFGIDVPNARLLADEWATQGFYVYIPDFFEGDPVPNSYLKDITPNLRDQEKATVLDKAASGAKAATALGPWLIKHREAVSKPLIDRFVKAVRDDPETGKIAAVGFCWGGRYSVLLGRSDAPSKVDCCISFHPSFLVTADFENLVTPTYILVGDKDAMMSESQTAEAKQTLQDKLGSRGRTKVYPDAVHGFAVRGDDLIESEKKQKEEASEEAVKFINETFAAL